MIEVFPTADDLAQAAADAVAETLRRALAARGRASLVATGGRSPGPVYDRLKDAELDWAHVVVTLSDDRCVPPDRPQSNARLVRERLQVGAAAKARFLPLWPVQHTIEAALRALMPFDAVLLGMGDDGHIASLIPGEPGLAAGMDPANTRLTQQTLPGFGTPPIARVTLTLNALLQSRAIFLLIAGEAKRQVIERAEAGRAVPVRALLTQDRVPVRILWSPNHE